MFEVIKNEPIIIPVPDLPILDAEEGYALAKMEITPLHQGIVNGPQKLIVSIPISRPLFLQGTSSVRTIQGTFFTGLFENLLACICEVHYPQIKFLANRDRMVLISGERSKGDINRVKNLLFKTAWETYAPVEAMFWKRISIGVRKTNGDVTLPELDENGCFLNNMKTEEGIKLYEWNYRAKRGLETAFNSNLQFDLHAYKNELALRSQKSPHQKSLGDLSI